MNNEKEYIVRTRFAPSPTGYMHIGNLRTAIFCYAIARQKKGKLIIRIEDTDRKRYIADAEAVIYKTLETCGIDYDEGPFKEGNCGPYRQSERVSQNIYIEYAKKLIESGDAYYCFCGHEEEEECEDCEQTFAKYDRHCLKLSKEEIEANLKANKPYVIRQKIPEGKTSFVDAVYGTIEVDNSELEDMILIKSDGYPTYNFANIVDDHLMGITHVVRGSEYLSSTPKYTLLYKAFGWNEPIYIHCPLITNEEHKKLSKRLGHSSVNNLLASGFLPETIVNYVSMLGWYPENGVEKFSLQEFVQNFDYRRMNKSSAVFDLAKFKWLNGEYYKAMEPEAFAKFIEPQVNARFDNSVDHAEIIELLQKRIECFEDIDTVLDFVKELPTYENDIFVNQKLKVDAQMALKVLQEFLPIVENLDDFSKDNVTATIKEFIEKNGYKNGQVLWPLRAALSGKMSSAGGAYELFTVFGKTESIRRLKIAIENLQK